jgi:glycogen operon protein
VSALEHGAARAQRRSFTTEPHEPGEDVDLRCGVAAPLGAHELEGGVNFALFSRDAVRVRLELFAGAEDVKPSRVVELDPVRNRTGDIWHVWVKGIPEGQLYAYRLDGPHDPPSGQRFDFSQLLLDPCATAIKRPTGNVVAPKSIFTSGQFDWRDDVPPRHAWSRTVIYETHVRGITAHPSSGVRFPGSYRGLTEKIPYLKELGVTAVQLMPVQEFDPGQCHARDPANGRPLRDYWGYEPVGFFAPNGAYSSAGDDGQQVAEFKEMVREFHAAGLEVIIDLVLDHTAEAGERGPTLCWRGIDNPIYYALGADKRQYVDATGSGNTLNANHPVVRELVLSALRHWVIEMHVDGFRVDLAAILGRDSFGQLPRSPALLEQIAEDPVLREAKLIAQGWDVAGAYQVGSFGELRWATWNARYRDDVRRFWRGDAGMLAAFANRVGGSQDLYVDSGKGPECGINLITCHEGFTLSDLVSFQCKHNLGNGESDCDGANENYSANYGTEGPTRDAAIEAIRARQVKNFLLTLFVSRGVPMLLGGDEFRRSQGGNNNAYCQDNGTSWYDWQLLREHAEVRDFVQSLAALRRAHPVLSSEEFYTPGQLRWMTPGLGKPDWSNPQARSAGCLIREGREDALYLMVNAEEKPMSFLIPPPPEHRQWRLTIDTSTDWPVSEERSLPGGRCRTVEARSSVLLTTAPAREPGQSPPEAVGCGGCDPILDACAEAMGGEDPTSAYAAAMLWYQGYPTPQE